MADDSHHRSGAMIGVGVAIGAAVFALTGNAVWLALGVAIGAAASQANPRKQRTDTED